MNKWTVTIIGALVFLGVAHYLESIEVKDIRDVGDPPPDLFGNSAYGDFYASSNGEIYEYTDEGLQRALWDLNETGGSIWEHCKVPRVIKKSP